ncbi:Isy1-like splicing factor [Lipomyces japonicus]|uniref:Isy1-like splicing factor n=1 Tax=Lipomyces japonicus TaxID=56871 RepID=UPI0034CD284A
MARNSEKAQSMLYRFREQEAAELGIIDVGRTRRPRVITNETSIPMCEKWRGQVIKEIGRKVTKIQDPGLSDYQIRDLNDEINKLMREKYVWEMHIRSLGGPNYSRSAGTQFDDQGRELPTTRGYKYFGRARELPGVKELLEPKKRQTASEIKTSDIGRIVDADYFGYRDEDDPELLTFEAKAEEISFGNTIKNDIGNPEHEWESIENPTNIPIRSEVENFILLRQQQRLNDF